MNAVDQVAILIESGDHFGAIQVVSKLVETVSALEKKCGEPEYAEYGGSGLPDCTVVVDADGDAWQRDQDEWRGTQGVRQKELRPKWGPYRIVYTPEETEGE